MIVVFSMKVLIKNLKKAVGRKVEFVQDNHSKSSKGVLRGLHYQLPPFAQESWFVVLLVKYMMLQLIFERFNNLWKMGWCKLSAENKRQLWIPEGFAHGFMVLSDEAEFLYKTTNYYAPNSDRGLAGMIQI
jgi:dTDP-4-dehydrorhamnose 3,5-epimerase